MAEEVKKIITVEVGKSITSVRDFKKHIEDLRGALLGLNEESEEYKTIAEQIATDQAKLNEVMSVGKNNTDAASGSYNELNNQLKALRQQYKALSETERNSTTGQAILQNITKLDEELKDIDESMGQYYRNVGNYKGAFEEAFKAMAQNIGNVNPELGKLMKTAASLIPLIKSASKAATTGLKGIKAGLASTGIGLLVVALGEIVANWEKISNWLGIANKQQKDLTEETKKTANALDDYANTLSKTISDYQNLMRSMGLTDDEQYTRLQGVLDTDKASLDGYLRYARGKLNELNTIQKNYKNAQNDGLIGNQTKMEDEVQNLERLIDEFHAYSKAWGAEVEDLKSSTRDIFGDPGNKQVMGAIEEERQIIQGQIDKLVEGIEEVNQKKKDLTTSYDILANQEITNTRKRAEELGKTEAEIRQKQYEEDIKAADARLDAKVISEDEYIEYVRNQEKQKIKKNYCDNTF